MNQVYVRYLPKEYMTLGYPMGRRQASRSSAMLWILFCQVDPYHLPLLQTINAFCHKAEIVQEWFEKHNNEFEVLTWPPKSSICGMCWTNKSDTWRSHLSTTGVKVSVAMIPKHTFRGLVEGLRVGSVGRSRFGSKRGIDPILDRW